MSPRLKIFNLVIERLKNLQEGCTGQLLGLSNEKTVFVLGISITARRNTAEEKEDSNDLGVVYDYDIVPNLPADVGVCGVFHISTGGSSSESLLENASLDKVNGIPVLLNINVASKEIIAEICEDNITKKVEYDSIHENDISKSFVYMRLTATIPLSCDFQYEHVEDSINALQQKITNGNAAFHLEDSEVYILGDSTEDVNGIQPESTVDKLYTTVLKSAENDNETGLFNVTLYLKGSNNELSPQLAPVIKYVKKTFKHVRIQLPLDGLSMVPKQLKVKELYPILVECVYRNLNLIGESLLDQLRSGEQYDVSLPQIYHFLPPACGHFISLVYPSKKSLEETKKTRETFHHLFSLPLDKPLLRPGNAYDFSNVSKTTTSKILLNPHEGLGKSGIPDGDPCFVQGVYAYHHYMQDNFDDSGWGCAYRSLQTVCSWFKLQGYTNMSVPTHKEIQQCLVDIGDKPSSFVGSKQWIGSTEVSFVLDTLLGVTCRIVSVSSGEELSMKGGELSYHFKTQGTPVMIGGGVLAHTILGVDYSKKTGAIKFLILDPHYTGGEDLNIIQGKGWCGWKGPEFWKKDAFYNMCMPLRPKCV